MKIFTRGMAALLALVMLFCMAACGSSELRTEIDSLKESVSELAAENEQLKQQAIEAKEELANQKAALEALKQDTEETLKNLEAALKGQFRIKVVDLDGEVLVDDAVLCKDAGSIVELLTESYGMVSYQSAYGTSVVSIAGSIVDSNYYVSISENGLYSEVGIDGLVIDVGDVFEFKVECWNTVASGYGTMDEYDLLVDQLIYSYMKTVLPAQVAAETAHTGMLFWDQAAVTFMAKSGYDTNLFCFAYSEEYKNALNAVDVTKLSGSDFMKYYYAKVSMGQELSQSFKDAFNATVATSCTDWLLRLLSHYDYIKLFSDIVVVSNTL